MNAISPTTPAIAIEHLTKRFNGNTAVDDVNISVPPGSFLVLVGPSGCGKSTLLRMLAGLEPPTEGQISFGGKVVTSGQSGVTITAAARDAGLVFQSYALWPHKTVEGNIDWPLKVANWSRQDRAARIDEVLKFLDIEALRHRYPAEISGGQQQRVAIARTIGPRPGILLLDEPLSNLDAKLRVDMRSELMRIHRATKATSVYVTHDQVEAMTMATHVAVLRNGRVEQFGPPDELLLRPQTTFVATFLGTPAGNLIPVERNGAAFRFNGVDLASATNAPGLETAQLLYRAQDITVGRRDGLPCAMARYAESAPIAGQSMVTCMIGDMRVTAMVDGFFRAEPGAEVEVTFLRAPDAVFNAEGQRVTE
ncbi:ABC transporter ATP-binding protein [Pseudorhodobacter sp.]|uniref:ABC transporter ATP-binding protein n=1 Tax=Pseudorhodobacter sp. TaxID=1934400 RepID=UPI00264A024F|nr:ABC transporter ATP-binding protein [Pseudorhodobacter sp.]MDN5788561.1 ABC transporter ATP-binding protein [Pseudorhodobacter sp.]